MKKLLLSALAIVTISTSAFAVDGTITKVQIKADNTIIVYLTDLGGVERVQKLVGTTDAIKAMLATVLVAKSSASTVTLNVGTGDNGTGWANVILQ